MNYQDMKLWKSAMQLEALLDVAFDRAYEVLDGLPEDHPEYERIHRIFTRLIEDHSYMKNTGTPRVEEYCRRNDQPQKAPQTQMDLVRRWEPYEGR
jgi:hypothetical protein